MRDLPEGEQARADAARVVPELRRLTADGNTVPVRTIGQQAGLSPDRAAAALAHLAETGNAVETDGAWSWRDDLEPPEDEIVRTDPPG